MTRSTASAARRVLPMVVLGACVALAAPPKRPTVDLQAMREAMSSGSSNDPAAQFPSAASYAHFLRARLSHHEGDHRRALDELRLALATDDGNPFLMTGMAEEYARLSDLDRAEAQLQRVLDLAPDFAPAQLLIGRVLYESNKTTRARAHLQRAIRLRPQDSDAYLVLTQLWLDQGRIDEAIKVVEELGRAVPGEPIGYRRLGLALAERGDLPRAEKLLLRAVERDPGDQECWVSLARIGETTGKPKEALEAYGHALERDPENAEVLLAAGRLALRSGDEAGAKAWFDQLLSLSRDPEPVVKVSFSWLAVHKPAQAAEVLDQGRRAVDEPRLHFYAGLVRERMRAWAQAAEAYALVPRELGELFHEARMHRAICLSSLGQHRASLELFRKVHDERPDLAGLDATWARATERAGQVKEAEALLIRALARSPSTETYEAIIGFFQRQNRPQDAVALFQGALVRQPGDDAVRFALASSLERTGEWQQAVETMRRVLAENPQNAPAMNFIGYSLADHGGDLDEAERQVRKALEARPDSAAYLDSLGWVLFKRNEAERAVEFLERACLEAPEEPTLREHLGDALARLKRADQARENWERALELLAGNPDGLERVNQRAELERKLKSLTSKGSGR